MKKRLQKLSSQNNSSQKSTDSSPQSNSENSDLDDDNLCQSTDRFVLNEPITIDSMAFGGRGVGRHEGKVYFVEDAIEGDLVNIEVTHCSDRYNEARVLELIKPSSHRGKSPCSYSDECGGCQWQGVDYSQQLTWKKHFLENAIKRIGKIGESISIDISPSPLINEYRNRIFVRARMTPTGELKVGYFKRASREFISIHKCMIANKRINRFIEEALKLNFRSILEHHKIDTEVKFRFEMQDLPGVPDESPHMLLSIYDSDQPRLPTQTIVDQFSNIKSVAWAGTPKAFPTAPHFPFEADLGVTFHTSAGVFQQINIEHNHKLRRLVQNEIKSFASSKADNIKILDLFCGSGNLSLALADGKNSIDGIEFSKKAIELAKYNAEVGRLSQTQYSSGDTEKYLWKLAKSGQKFDVIIADPPRDGMFKSLIPLMKLKPSLILYISCDPTTLSRDLNTLCKREYKIQSIQALDFFPNTYHIESFAVLSRIAR